MTKKIEDLEPHFKTVVQALRYALEILDKDWTDEEKIRWVRHQIRDAMHILGYTSDQVRTYRRESEPPRE